ncbi:MAG TPA: hypothetical protein VI306_10345 [Pyrinomonadaceae bacterium]
MNIVAESGKESLSAVEMFVRFNKFSICSKQKSEIVFYACLVTCVTSFLEMKAGCRKFDQGPIDVVNAVFNRAKILKHHSKLIVKSSLERMIRACLKEWRGLC